MEKENVFKSKSKKGAMLLSMLIAASLLSGCTPEKSVQENLDVLTINNIDEKGFVALRQVLDVPGEDFKLIAEYNTDLASQRSWRITSNKFLYLKVYTQGLEDGKKVYLDNVHIDTSIVSEYAAADGVLQDTMDDRIHNSLMYGFPISDDIHYHGVNAIEGMNDSFIKTTFYVINGLGTGTSVEKRYTESDYIDKMGVSGNKIQVVYDLLVQNGLDVPRNTSVASDFKVDITNQNNPDQSKQLKK